MDKMFIDVIKRRVREFRLSCGDTNIPTNCKDVLYGVLERYLNTYEDTLEFFPARYYSAFRWGETPEGNNFWGRKHEKWLKFLTNRKISKYTRIDRAKT